MMQSFQDTADDTETLTNRFGSWKRRDASQKGECSTLQRVLVGLLLISLVAAFSAVIGMAIRLKAVRQSCPPPPECLHALGGGPVSPGGSIKGAAPGYCQPLLAAYADPAAGSYWKEVELAADTAMQVFGFANNSLHTSQQLPTAAVLHFSRLLLVEGSTLDSSLEQQAAAAAAAAAAVGIEGTGNSNSVAQLGGPVPAATRVGGPFPGPDRRLVVVFDIDETVLSNMQQILHPSEWPWDRWVTAAAAPPLLPVQRFYKALCAAGYSVAFVTGRREAQRQPTVDNLAAAGFGSICQQNANGDTGSPGRASGGNGNGQECCYEALYMRQPNDTRLASVYKPWARQQLTAGGKFELLALVGDQFSDINGDAAAPYAFKLPNPFYYIL